MKKLADRGAAGNGGRALKAQGANQSRRAEKTERLDPEVERWFTAAGSAFPASRSSLIPMLQSAQSALGYLPSDAMRTIARHLTAPPALIEGVASFYAQFRFNKPGRHRVTVCSGTACYVRGSGKLMADMQAKLRIVPGGTTADGEISLESVSCFGACALAPVVVLDDKVLRQQTTASLKKTIDDLSTGSPKSRPRAARPPSAVRRASK